MQAVILESKQKLKVGVNRDREKSGREVHYGKIEGRSGNRGKDCGRVRDSGVGGNDYGINLSQVLYEPEFTCRLLLNR